MTIPGRIITKRLVLRKPRMDDAADIFKKYARDRKVTKYLIWKPHKQLQTVRSFLKKTIKNMLKGDECPYVIEKRSTGELIGMITARITGHKASIGYVLARKFWGKGFATEAAISLIKILKKERSIFRIWATCDNENKASARVLVKSGMKLEGILKKWIKLHSFIKPRDALCYSVTRK